jgi:hypothetical protein
MPAVAAERVGTWKQAPCCAHACDGFFDRRLCGTEHTRGPRESFGLRHMYESSNCEESHALPNWLPFAAGAENAPRGFRQPQLDRISRMKQRNKGPCTARCRCLRSSVHSIICAVDSNRTEVWIHAADWPAGLPAVVHWYATLCAN